VVMPSPPPPHSNLAISRSAADCDPRSAASSSGLASTAYSVRQPPASACSRFHVQGSGFRKQGLGFRKQGLGFRK
jgi:hypothetical protein